MRFFRKYLKTSREHSIQKIPSRFRLLFRAHDLDIARAPELVPGLAFAALATDEKLLATLTPDLIHVTAAMFGVRSEWLQGIDDQIYNVHWSKHDPAALLDVLSTTLPSTEQPSLFPLRFLTTSKKLDRQGEHEQWLLPVVVEHLRDVGEDHVCRFHVFANFYDWTNTPFRLEAKAIARTVYLALKIPVTMYEVSEDVIEQVMVGKAFPPLPLQSGLLPSSCLEDYALSREESYVAKEVNELSEVMGLLDARGLSGYRLRRPEALFIAEQEQTTLAPPPAPPTPTTGGKRQIQTANWEAIIQAAKTLWAQYPNESIAGMIERLRPMSHLKASALSDSAMHKRIAPHAPANVRGKPGRKPKYST